MPVRFVNVNSPIIALFQTLVVLQKQMQNNDFLVIETFQRYYCNVKKSDVLRVDYCNQLVHSKNVSMPCVLCSEQEELGME